MTIKKSLHYYYYYILIKFISIFIIASSKELKIYNYYTLIIYLLYVKCLKEIFYRS